MEFSAPDIFYRLDGGKRLNGRGGVGGVGGAGGEYFSCLLAYSIKREIVMLNEKKVKKKSAKLASSML